MKTFNLSFLFVIVSFFYAKAQITTNIQYGLKAGVNLSFIGVAIDDPNAKPLYRIASGINATYNLDSKFSIELGVDYAQLGAQIKDKKISEFEKVKTASEDGTLEDLERITRIPIPIDGFYNRKFKLDYINIPVVLKYNISQNFRVFSGPQIGFLLSAKNETSVPEETTTAIDKNIETIDGYIDQLGGIIETNSTLASTPLATLILIYPQYADLLPEEYLSLSIKEIHDKMLEARGFLGDAQRELNVNGTDDNVKPIDLGLVFGSEYQFKMGLYIDFRFNLGLLDILKVKDDPRDFAKNRSALLAIGYRF